MERRLERLGTITVCLLFFVIPHRCPAATRYVSPTGGNVYPYDTWQRAALVIDDAIDAADSNETVMVAAGVYYVAKPVSPGQGVKIQGSGPSSSIITTTNQIALFDVGDDAIIDGLGFHAVSNAIPTWAGIIRANGVVRNCHISNPQQAINTGCIWMNQGGILKKSVVEGADGTGIYMDHGGLIDGCIVRDCGWITEPRLAIGQYGSDSGGGVFIEHYGTVRNSLIDHNRSGYAGGVFMYIFAVVENCTIVNNHAVRCGGGIEFYHGGEIARNSIVYYNTAGVAGPDAYGLSAGIYSNLCSSPADDPNFGLPPSAPGAVTNEPGFVDRANGDYRLPVDSPCVNGGVYLGWMTSAARDLDGGRRIRYGRVDIGALEFRSQSIVNDYNGDGRSEMAVYCRVPGRDMERVYVRTLSGIASVYSQSASGSNGVPAPGDYDGDETGDLAFYRPGDKWVWNSCSLTDPKSSIQNEWGYDGCIPVFGDYDGDGRDDLAAYDPVIGKWFIRTVSGKVLAWNLKWGFDGATPVAGDYDGDGRADLALYDLGTGKWYIHTLAGKNLAWKLNWGYAGAIPVPGDYDRDGRADLAVFHPASGRWFVYSLAKAKKLAWDVRWGFDGCTPVAGDYDGDGRTDLAVYHQASGKWYIRKISDAILAWNVSWGWSEAPPVKP